MQNDEYRRILSNKTTRTLKPKPLDDLTDKEIQTQRHILRYLADGPMSRTEIWQRYPLKGGAAALTVALDTLESEGLIAAEKVKRGLGGYPATVYRLAQP